MTLREWSRLLHLASRTAGDVDAANRGRLIRRVARRHVVRTLARRLPR